MKIIQSGTRVCAAFILGAATAITLPAQVFTSLHSLNGTDGQSPQAALVQSTDGNLYGATTGGGALGSCINGCGTLYKISPSGALTILHNFDGADGYYPAALVQAGDGNLYGTTTVGGAHDSCSIYGVQVGCGTIFKITPGGTLTTLYNFCSYANCGDGSEPTAGLVQAPNGNFYGTTSTGGVYGCAGFGGCGTVFQITPSGTRTTLYKFCSQYACADGEYPYAGLVQAVDGNFYGTTYAGGAKGAGTVFKITPAGILTTLYSFCSQSGCVDGEYPNGLIQAANGNLYGTTQFDGANGSGTVFKITPSGTLSTLYSFCAQPNCTDGQLPVAGLIQGTDGNFYGTTSSGGGSLGWGTVFEITVGGTLKTLHSFDGTDGTYPWGLVQDTNGSFYGITNFGGVSGNNGTVFSLFAGLGPFVETQPAAGKVGAPIKILGTSLAGATSVTFNGTSAVFRVISSSVIGTTVPSGATSGEVRVVTPGGTLSSNVLFRVKP